MAEMGLGKDRTADETSQIIAFLNRSYALKTDARTTLTR